ncbi:MAG: Na(+)/H(+) antiporter subunit D [Pseudomonadota bacterium]
MLPAVFTPGVLFTIGAFLCIAMPAAFRRYAMLVVIAVSAVQLVSLPLGEYGAYQLFGQDLLFVRYDALARIFAVVFHIAAALNVVYGWHVKDASEQWAGLAYPGAALGGVMAGDWVTLFVWWEMAALTSVFLVWAPQTRSTYLSGFRYLAIQIASGVALLGGIVLLFRETGSLAFGGFNEVGVLTAAGEAAANGAGHGEDHAGGGTTWRLATLLVFLAFGVKSAFPLLHNWVQDAYPKSSLTGTIMLSVFTTKFAVYALARGFAGTPELIAIGCVMTIFPIFFALIENDLRKVLCYSINNQVGFMVVGIGVGSAMSVNGAVGYAFCNIIFESLLFMGVGAAAYRVGSTKATELGGLYRTMPLTMLFTLAGAFSIAAFPLFAGFVTKGLIIDGVAEEHLMLAWLVLLFASAGALEHSGIKIPYFTFFAHDSGKRPQEAPAHMLIAMGVSAVLCLAIGLAPGAIVYPLMPFQEQTADYHPYAMYHVVEQLQLLLFATLAFALLIKFKLYPPEIPSTNLDFDWLWRVPGRATLGWAVDAAAAVWRLLWSGATDRIRDIVDEVYALHGPQGRLARSWPIGSMALWTAVLLGAALILSFISPILF